MATFLTVEQAAEKLHISAYTIRELLKAGKLPGRKIGKTWRLVEEDIAEWIRQGNQGQQDRTQ